MNHKERVLTALNHEEPDRVPVFYWAVPEFTQKMMSELGFSDVDRLLEHLDIDFRWVEPVYSGPKLVHQKKGKKKDIWGVEYDLVGHGDLRYWEATRFPLQGITDPGVLEDYPWPHVGLFDFNSLSGQVEKYKDYSIMTAPGYSSPGLFRIIQRLIGRDSFLDVMMYNPHFFKTLVDKVTDFYVDFIEHFFAVTGDKVDFIRIADDFGASNGLVISNENWNNYCRPAIERFMELPRKLGVKYYMHSCGAVRKLLPEFISLGADVLDPIQTRAEGMNPLGLKKDFGRMITFSGGLDEELLLRKSTPDHVREGVRELIDTMAPGGGFIIGPSHKIKVETPVENVLAMYEAVKEYSGQYHR
ncbi:uroporphyrinogen decarboxylase [Marinilabilia salmonicolor]|jgi:uroporphyrinogen decarboxylase|uniref:uroporphyrinogen decarboxylase family protein n=1 Tax=Marinilabilia salmonicolor TaxID=989 RepID=UPI000D080FD6|nr:uroporphyrinogen decarboxylase family protein [Marinilabilia salmonicolor]PRY99983.1 uroporphyrinogen decarboxylase [Marinilabilia salmonicolor]